MAVLNVQNFSSVGVAPAFAAATSGGDNFPGNGTCYLFVKNASASSMTATVNSIAPCSYGFDHDLVTTVGAGATVQIGPFPASRYNDANGNVNITYSAVTSVTVAVVSMQ